MLEIEFHDRNKEIREIMRIQNSRPDLITFVYGPINSGKSSLMDEAVNRLSNNYVVSFIDLKFSTVIFLHKYYIEFHHVLIYQITQLI